MEELQKLKAELENLLKQQPASREELMLIVEKVADKKTGILARLQQILKNAPREEKPLIGREFNALKRQWNEWKSKYEHILAQSAESSPIFDPTMPGIQRTGKPNRLHPVFEVLYTICEIFEKMGFLIAEGPEIETDWYNFTALNIPEDHPAREMQDTFYVSLNPPVLLRTHTSPVQIRVLERKILPVRIIAPGRVYRNETVSARAHVQFHQVEGLYVDESVSVADLKGTLDAFARELFGSQVTTRYRISYFPFTEPSFEMDVSCTLCKGRGCTVCKRSGWVEILGCGMVDPQVFVNCGLGPAGVSGFAFGLGVERITMLLMRIDDIRDLFRGKPWIS